VPGRAGLCFRHRPARAAGPSRGDSVHGHVHRREHSAQDRTQEDANDRAHDGTQDRAQDGTEGGTQNRRHGAGEEDGAQDRAEDRPQVTGEDGGQVRRRRDACAEEGETRDARAEGGNPAQRIVGEEGDEQEAGDRHRPLRGAQGRRQGARPEDVIGR